MRPNEGPESMWMIGRWTRGWDHGRVRRGNSQGSQWMSWKKRQEMWLVLDGYLWMSSEVAWLHVWRYITSLSFTWQFMIRYWFYNLHSSTYASLRDYRYYH